MLKQFSTLQESCYDLIVENLRDFFIKFKILKSGKRKESQKFSNSKALLQNEIKSILLEEFGTVPKFIFDFEAFDEFIIDLTIEEIEKARLGNQRPTIKNKNNEKNSKLENSLNLSKSIPFYDFNEDLFPTTVTNTKKSQVENLDLGTNFAANLSLLKSDPWKFVLTDIDFSSSNEEILSAVYEACGKQSIDITKIECFYDFVEGKQRKNAYVSVSSQQDLSYVLSDNFKAFGIYISGERVPVSSVDNKNIIKISTKDHLSDVQIMEILQENGVEDYVNELKKQWPDEEKEKKIEIFCAKNSKNEPLSNAWIIFPNHESAYIAYQILTNFNKNILKCRWSHNEFSRHQQVLKTYDSLIKENKEIKKEIKKEILNKSKFRNPNNEDSLNNTIYQHIERVLETVGGKTKEASILLKIKETKLKFIMKDLKNEGFTFKKEKMNSK